jgi:hypothetical protein
MHTYTEILSHVICGQVRGHEHLLATVETLYFTESKLFVILDNYNNIIVSFRITLKSSYQSFGCILVYRLYLYVCNIVLYPHGGYVKKVLISRD